MDAGKRTKEATAGQIEDNGKIGGQFKITKSPAFLEERLKYFDDLHAKQKQQLDEAPKREIDITLKDGKVLKGTVFQTTPLDIAMKISKKLAESMIAAKIVYSKKDPNPLISGGIVDTDETGEGAKIEQGEVYDLTRPLEGDCTLELLPFDDPLAKNVFWHSSAHILGSALELEYGAQLCIGPPLENGFYYDAYIGDHKISPNEFTEIEKTFQKVAQANHPFKKVYLSKAQALELFKHNPFKVQLISKKIPEGSITTAYCSGNLIDLCTGPHLPTTNKIKAFKCTKASAAYWLGKSENDDLQRVYGVSFPQQKLLDEYIKIQEELAKRDHRNIGKQQELFTINNMSPGAAFFLPHGTRIYNKLISLMRREYDLRGYTEVISPNIYNKHLWETSGHWFKYRENIFQVKVEEQDFGVKPMNCPGHCLIFDSTLRSYKELPIRYAEFGVLHRNEISGALSGLTRVRRFVQDDSHIFCTMEQIQDEILGVLDLLRYIYNIFGFTYKLFLSTRPEAHLGDVEIWDKAEAQLSEALNRFGHPWKLNPGDGAFYGPKIDIALCDAFGREHQCGTIQLDFNLPQRFNLQFRAGEDEHHDDEEHKKAEGKKEEKPKKVKEPKAKKEKNAGGKGEKPEGKVEKTEEAKPADAPKEEKEASHSKPSVDTHHHETKPEGGAPQEPLSALEKAEVAMEKAEAEFNAHSHVLKPGFQRPVMIHRAIYGSLERFIAIVIEMNAGKWPFWLSPRQVIILPLSEKFIDYAEAVHQRLKLEGFDAEIDRSNVTINKKVRNAQLQQYNFIAVCGEEEMNTGTVDVRERDKTERLGKFTIPDLIQHFRGLEVPDSDFKHKVWSKAYFHPSENKQEHQPHSKPDQQVQMEEHKE